MQLVARPRLRFAVIPTKSASLSRRGRGLRGTMVFLLFDQMHGENVGFVQRTGSFGPGPSLVWKTLVMPHQVWMLLYFSVAVQK